MIKIYDYDGNLRDWDWLRAEFGDVRVHPVEERFPVREGERIYKTCYLRAKSGYAAILINAKDRDGQNVTGEAVVFGWSSAEPHGLANTGHNWTDNGVVGHTNETGDVGPGMGTGAYYSPADGERGPHWCWVYGLPSDYVDGLGMLAMTNHNHVDVGYCEVIAGDVEPPEPPPPVNGELLTVAKEIRDAVLRIEQKIGSTPPEPPPPADTLFRGEYFNNTTLSGAPALIRDDEKIDFDWGEESPDPKVNANDFSVRWTATKTFAAGSHRFTVVADDGVRLWVDGVLIVDAWKPQSATTYTADVILGAGQHEIKMEYFERGGLSVAKLSWN